MAQKPNNSRIVQVINFGVDKRLPLGVVNQVIDKATNNLIGYMRGDKFYKLGTDAGTVEAEIVEQDERNRVFAETTAKAQEENDPFLRPFTDKKLGVTVDPNDGNTIVADGDGSEVFIYVGPSAAKTMFGSASKVYTKPAGEDTEIEVLNDFDAIRKKMLTDATTRPGGIDDLFGKLYQTGLMSKETYEARNVSAPDFNKGLLYALRKFSIETVDNYTIKGIKTPVNFTDYITKGFKPPKSRSVKTTYYDPIVTLRQDAAEDADQFFMARLGRNATKEEENRYYELLRDAEKKVVQSTTTRYDAEGNKIGRSQSGELMSELDKTLILGRVAGKAIEGSNIDTLLKSGGKAADDVNSLLSYARNYGVVLTKEQAMSYVANNLKKGQNIDASKNKILQIAKAQPQYSAISNKITDEVSVNDLAGNYIYQKAQLLELSVDSIDVFDKDIQDGLTGNLSMTDFNKKLRQNPKWATTKNAKEEAANYATDILRSFGLMA